MPRRLAASLSLLVFAICLIAGLQADNPLATVLSRALVAMASTMVISLVIGTMAQRMVEENVQKREQELRDRLTAEATDAASAAALAGPQNSAATANKAVAK